MTGIRPLTLADRTWAQRIWTADLGAFGLTWYRYWCRTTTAERWVGIADVAFAHYRVKRDGSVTLYEIAVAPERRREGIGSQLLAYLSEQGARSVALKTDSTNVVSNAFYAARGFTRIGEHASQNGKKMLVEYAR